MITLDHATKKFGKVEAINSLSLTLQDGQLTSLIGPNGSGKTTLIKSILGLVQLSSGTITVNGKNIKQENEYRKIIGYMPQMGRFPDHMTVEQLFGIIKGLRKIQEANLDLDLYNEFEIKEFSNKSLGSLSGGMRQKVSAAIAFLFHPQILILDEPTAGLDPISSEIFKNKIRKENLKNKLVIITSHILSDIEDITTHVIYMQEGKLLYYGKIDELYQNSGEQNLSRSIAYLMRFHQQTNPLKAS